MSKHHSRKNNATPDRKPSVFQRLGSKASSKHLPAICQQWADDGVCSLGKNCGLAHFDLFSKSTKLSSMKKCGGKKSNRDDDRRSRSADTPEPSAGDGWDYRTLECADERDLEKRRLQLQRELRLQMKKEKGSSKKKTKKSKKTARSTSSSSSSSSDSSSSSTSSTDSRYASRKRKASPSSDSDESPQRKKRKSPKVSKISYIEKKKVLESPRKSSHSKKVAEKRGRSSSWDRGRLTLTAKKKSPVRSKPRAPSPKHKQRDPSPRRQLKTKERRSSPSRSTRLRSPDWRRHHSPTSSSRPKERVREAVRGGLEKGGKILPVKSSAYVKEMKEVSRKKPDERGRDDKEKEKEKEKRRREQKAREAREAERREKEREAEKVKRDNERQKEREEALERCRERQRERDRSERLDRDKRLNEDSRKTEVKSDLPSLLDIKTEVPREPSRRPWEERRPRREDESFDYRRPPQREETEGDSRREGKHAEPGGWQAGEPPPSGQWGRDWKPRFEQKWGNEQSRESTWRENFTGRRPPPDRLQDWHTGPSADDVVHSDVGKPGELHRWSDGVGNEGPSHQDDGRRVGPPHQDDSRRVGPPHQDDSRRVGPHHQDDSRRVGPPLTPIGQHQSAEAAPDLDEVLSDISDDADDILNQDDEQTPEILEAVPPVCISQQGADFFFDHRRPLLECFGEKGFDFEEISDEELEEEAKMGKGIMDVLGADWASLMKPTEVAAVKVEGAGSAQRRWRVDNILSRFGLSYKLAGKEFADKYLSKIRKHCQEVGPLEGVEKNDAQIEIKSEEAVTVKNEQNGSIESDIKVNVLDPVNLKKENGESKELKLEHEVAAINTYLRHGGRKVQELLNPRFRGALSARSDLSLRRVLCGLPTREPIHFPGNDVKLFESSVASFKTVAA